MRKPAFNTFLFLSTVIFAGTLNAAGLGKLTVNSTLGQPFMAEIDLVAVKKEERFSLAARLASRDTFRLAHVDYSPSLSTFKTSIETRADGQPYIKVVSAQPVAEPLLNMLIELNWSSGRLLREYTVLLPMAEADANDTSAARTSSSSDRPPSSPGVASGLAPLDRMENVPGKQLQEPARENKAQKGAVGPVPSLPRGNTVYGPVKQGDTLGGAVRNIIPPPGVSFNQMLIALQRANIDAFLGGNIHQLKAGAILRIPDLSEIKAITRVEADKEVDTQTLEWNRRKSPAVTSSILPADELKQTVSGKITAADPEPGAAEPPREVLRLSRGEELPGNNRNKDGIAYHAAAPPGAAMTSGQDKLHMVEEDATATDSSLLEANERIALLEKNISDLQRLLELRRLALAELQQQPRSMASEPTATPERSPTPSAFQPTGEMSSHSAAAMQSSSFATLISIAGASVSEAPGVTAPILAVDSSLVEIAGPVAASPFARNKPETEYSVRPGSLIEDLTGNVEYLGGALVLLITGIVGVSMSRRPREMLFADSDTGRAFDLRESSPKDKAAPLTQRDKEESVGTSVIASNSIAEKISGDPATGSSEAGSFQANTEQYRADSVQSVRVPNLSRSSRPAPSLPLSLSPGRTASAPSMGSIYPERMKTHLDISGASQPGPPAWYRQGKAAPWHEIVNKIDLARAYQEMGDNDAAGQVLQEVMREGDIQQQARAKVLLSNL